MNRVREIAVLGATSGDGAIERLIDQLVQFEPAGHTSEVRWHDDIISLVVAARSIADGRELVVVLALGDGGARPEAVTDLAKHLPDIPVVVVTEPGDAGAALDALGRGADAYVVLGDSVLEGAEELGEVLAAAKARRGERVRLRTLDALKADMLDAVMLPVMAIDTSGHVVLSNRAARDLFGWTAQDLRDRNLLDLMVPPDQRARADQVAGAIISGRDWEDEIWLNRRDGTQFPALVAVTPMLDDDTGTPALVLVSLKDVTVRHEAMEKVRFQARLLESVSEAAVATDTDGNVVFWNAAAERIFGWPTSEILGRPARDCLVRDDERERAAAATAAVSAGDPWSGEIWLKRRDGSSFPALVSGTAVYDEAGELAARIGITSDLSALHEVQRAAAVQAAARKAAERTSHAKSEFLSRVSHELRTPLNSVLGFAQILEEVGGLDGRGRDAVDHILLASRHLLGLINDLLDVARIEEGAVSLAIEPVPVADLVAEAVEILGPEAKLHGVAVGVVLHASGPLHVRADRQRALQVVLNLLSNAVKYAGAGSTVTVSASVEQEELVVISVADDGPGIPQDLLDRAFVPFDRLGAEGSGVEGTGMGLAVARSLAERMGGSLEAESEPGHGSTFSFVLARSSVAPTDTHRQRAMPAVEGSPPITVLYIEDNEANRQLLWEILRTFRDGVELVTAGTADEGVALARDRLPDLILLDNHLPDAEGIDVLRELVSDPVTGDIPVVMVSADAQRNVVEGTLLEGAHRYLTKPIDIPALLAVVDEIAKR